MPLNPSGIFYADTSTAMSIADITAAQATSISAIINEVLTTAVPVGVVATTAAAAAPSGWMICDGSAISRSTYANLYTALGGSASPYGQGDGSSTFNLPNLKGKVIVSQDASQTEFDVRAESGGAKTHTLTTAQMPSHKHTDSGHTHAFNANTTPAFGAAFFSTEGYGIGTGGAALVKEGYASIGSGTANLSNTGGGEAHNNLQPYMVMNHIIKF